jgi:hypothetical protein
MAAGHFAPVGNRWRKNNEQRRFQRTNALVLPGSGGTGPLAAQAAETENGNQRGRERAQKQP